MNFFDGHPAQRQSGKTVGTAADAGRIPVDAYMREVAVQLGKPLSNSVSGLP
jgi:hypothetical protein